MTRSSWGQTLIQSDRSLRSGENPGRCAQPERRRKGANGHVSGRMRTRTASNTRGEKLEEVLPRPWGQRGSDFRSAASRTETAQFYVLSHPVCGTSLWQLQETRHPLLETLEAECVPEL